MRLTDVMKGPRRKVKRAYEHIDALIRDTAVMPDHLYEVTNGLLRRHILLAKPDSFALAYRPKEDIPEHFGAIIGDALNNLRESLDYWINAAVQCIGPKRRLHFPFAGKGERVEDAKTYGAVEKAFPDAAQFIAKDIDPRRDTNLLLWAVTGLRNDNAHNDFIPVVTLSEIKNLDTRIGNIRIADLTIGGDANSPLILIRSPYPIPQKDDLKVSVEILFGKGTPFEDQPVIPTLTNMAEVVTKTLDALEKFIAPYCK